MLTPLSGRVSITFWTLTQKVGWPPRRVEIELTKVEFSGTDMNDPGDRMSPPMRALVVNPDLTPDDFQIAVEEWLEGEGSVVDWKEAYQSMSDALFNMVEEEPEEWYVD